MTSAKPGAVRLIESRLRTVGRAEVRRLLPHHTQRMVGPFIFADLIGPDALSPGSGVDIDAHPHIGLATISYLFDGRLVHRDSTGSVQTVEPGAVNWMTAGAGIAHTERSHPDDRARATTIHGLQTWVALPDETADGPPGFEHRPAVTIPTIERGHSQLRIAAGSAFGLESPVTVSSPLLLVEARLNEKSPITLDTTHPEIAVLVVDGNITIDSRVVKAGTLAVVDRGVKPVIGGTGIAIFLGGEPVGPRHIWWNFVHRDRARIEQAKHEWSNQQFATVPDDHEPWVPLPTS